MLLIGLYCIILDYTGERPYACSFTSICTKTFKNRRDVRKHETQVHGEKRFECCFCRKKLSSSSNLDYHVQSLHPGMRIFKCDFCLNQRSFPTCQERNLHIQQVHADTIGDEDDTTEIITSVQTSEADGEADRA